MAEEHSSKRIAIVAVVMDGDRTLVIRRADGLRSAGYWSPVVGHVATGESESDAVVREVRERVGLEVRAIKRVWESHTEDGAYDLKWWLADYVKGDVAPSSGEVGEVQWISPSEFETLDNTYPSDRHFYSEVFPQLEKNS